MDLQDPVNNRTLSGIGPTRFEYNPYYVFTRITVMELRNGVFHRLVLFKELGFLENLTANCTGEDVVSEREEEVTVAGGYVGFRWRQRLFSLSVGELIRLFRIDKGDS